MMPDRGYGNDRETEKSDDDKEREGDDKIIMS